jgi:hypothetical protein
MKNERGIDSIGVNRCPYEVGPSARKQRGLGEAREELDDLRHAPGDSLDRQGRTQDGAEGHAEATQDRGDGRSEGAVVDRGVDEHEDGVHLVPTFVLLAWTRDTAEYRSEHPDTEAGNYENREQCHEDTLTKKSTSVTAPQQPAHRAMTCINRSVTSWTIWASVMRNAP